MRTDQRESDGASVEQAWKEGPSDRVGAQDQLTNNAGEELGTTSIAPSSSTLLTLELQMDTDQVEETTSDHGWGEGETILGDSESHETDMEEEEGNGSSSDSSTEELMIETDMTHPDGSKSVQSPFSPSPPR